MVTSNSKRQLSYYSYEAFGRIDRIAQCILPGGDAALLEIARVFGMRLPPHLLNPGTRRLSIASGMGSAAVRHNGDAVAVQEVIIRDCQYGGIHPYCQPRPEGGVPNGGEPGSDPWEGGGIGGGGDQPSPDPMTENDVPEDVGEPDCASPRNVYERAYCSGNDPD